jgi:hypothetical protein
VKKLGLSAQHFPIKICKEKALYPGHQIGTIETPEKFLSKSKNKKISELASK